MRIALIVDRLRPSGGGLERYLGDLRAFLEGKRDEVHLLSGAPAALPRGLRERAFATRVDRALRDGGFDASLALRHARRAHVYEPHGGAIDAGLEARAEVAPWPRLSRAGHRLAPRARAFRALERAALANSRVVVAISSLVARDLRAIEPRARIEVLPLAVDLERFSPRGERSVANGPSGVTILFVGHDFDLKGLPAALGALARIARVRADARLLVAGAASPAARRRALGGARARGVADRVRFLGAVADPAPLYRGASLLLHPTRYDPCSLATLEALACGLPVVTTARNGASELAGAALRAVDDPADEEGLASEALALLGAGAPAREAARAAVARRAAPERFERLRAILAAAAGPLGAPLPVGRGHG